MMYGMNTAFAFAAGLVLWSGLDAATPCDASNTEHRQPDRDEADARFATVSAEGLSIEAHRFGIAHMLLRGAAGADNRTDMDAYGPYLQAIEAAAGGRRIWALLDPELTTRDELNVPAWLDSLPLNSVVEDDRIERTREAIGAYLERSLLPVNVLLHDSWVDPVLPELTDRGTMLMDELTGDGGLLDLALRPLGIDIASGNARVVLVSAAPRPGAMTYRTESGPVSIVAVDGVDDATLLEITLHEAIHAFDSLATGDRRDAFGRLRLALSGAGLEESDPRFRTAWHTLFFVHAAEMVRRDGRPEYVDYGERSGVYRRTGPIAAMMREQWPRVLDGTLSMREFAEAVSAGVVHPGGDAPG